MLSFKPGTTATQRGTTLGQCEGYVRLSVLEP